MTDVELLEQLPRFVFMAFSAYALALVLFRWQVTRVMTQDRRFLLLFFVLELGTTLTSGTLKIAAGTPADIATWLTVLTQSFLTAYLHYSIPPEFKSLRRRMRGKARVLLPVA